MKICILSSNFPTRRHPETGTFVLNLAEQWADLGHTVSVICPMPIHDSWGATQEHEYYSPAGNYPIKVQYPRYLSFGNATVLSYSFLRHTHDRIANAYTRALSSQAKFDLYYGKFLGPATKIAGLIARENCGKSLGDIGESRLNKSVQQIGVDHSMRILNGLDKIVCVSESLRVQLTDLGIDKGKILLSPNSVDRTRFRPLNKIECRVQLGLPLDAFIVIFVGHFIDRKGFSVVENAVNTLPDVRGIFCGSGSSTPVGKNILHAGPVANKDLPIWLNAADVFALPTLAEGHCNAIEEAIACGLPIISSNIPEVVGQVPPEGAILVDPNEALPQVIDAIFRLKNSQRLRADMENVLRSMANQSNLQERAKRILEWALG